MPAGPAEASGHFAVVLTAAGDRKIQAIKTVREITGLGLKEAKDLVDSGHATVKEHLTAADAESLSAKLRAAGAQCEVRPEK